MFNQCCCYTPADPAPSHSHPITSTSYHNIIKPSHCQTHHSITSSYHYIVTPSHRHRHTITTLLLTQSHPHKWLFSCSKRIVSHYTAGKKRFLLCHGSDVTSPSLSLNCLRMEFRSISHLGGNIKSSFSEAFFCISTNNELTSFQYLPFSHNCHPYKIHNKK